MVNCGQCEVGRGDTWRRWGYRIPPARLIESKFIKKADDLDKAKLITSCWKCSQSENKELKHCFRPHPFWQTVCWQM